MKWNRIWFLLHQNKWMLNHVLSINIYFEISTLNLTVKSDSLDGIDQFVK